MLEDTIKRRGREFESTKLFAFVRVSDLILAHSLKRAASVATDVTIRREWIVLIGVGFAGCSALAVGNAP